MSASGEHQTPSRAPLGELVQRYAVAILVAVTLGTCSRLWAHESRLTVVETTRKVEARSLSKEIAHLREDMAELKADVKKLLEDSR